MKKNERNVDVTVPTVFNPGKTHPLSRCINDLKDIMNLGGLIEETGPVIEDEEHNFDALNVDTMHPARDMHDTFYLPGALLLRTHITPVSVRVLESRKYRPPFGIYTLGRVYRNDSDRTHSPMFHQMDALCVGDFSFGHLKGMVEHILANLFNSEIQFRFRPSYFPFTEPSTEIDIMDKNIGGNWMEVIGGGMFRKNILERYGYGGYNAYAFGLGVERIAMLRDGIENINDLYKNRFHFLKEKGVPL